MYLGCYLAAAVKESGVLIEKSLYGTRILKEAGIRKPAVRKKEMKRFFHSYLKALGKERMKLIRNPEGLIRCGAYMEKQRREEKKGKHR